MERNTRTELLTQMSLLVAVLAGSTALIMKVKWEWLLRTVLKLVGGNEQDVRDVLEVWGVIVEYGLAPPNMEDVAEQFGPMLNGGRRERRQRSWIYRMVVQIENVGMATFGALWYVIRLPYRPVVWLLALPNLFGEVRDWVALFAVRFALAPEVRFPRVMRFMHRLNAFYHWIDFGFLAKMLLASAGAGVLAATLFKIIRHELYRRSYLRTLAWYNTPDDGDLSSADDTDVLRDDVVEDEARKAKKKHPPKGSIFSRYANWKKKGNKGKFKVTHEDYEFYLKNREGDECMGNFYARRFADEGYDDFYDVYDDFVRDYDGNDMQKGYGQLTADEINTISNSTYTFSYDASGGSRATTGSARGFVVVMRGDKTKRFVTNSLKHLGLSADVKKATFRLRRDGASETLPPMELELVVNGGGAANCEDYALWKLPTHQKFEQPRGLQVCGPDVDPFDGVVYLIDQNKPGDKQHVKTATLSRSTKGMAVYNCDTMPGSSGSPLLKRNNNDELQVVAMHSAALLGMGDSRLCVVIGSMQLFH